VHRDRVARVDDGDVIAGAEGAELIGEAGGRLEADDAARRATRRRASTQQSRPDLPPAPRTMTVSPGWQRRAT